jgi:hypothetical protein
VALIATGTILHVHGSSGAFTTVDLDVFQQLGSPLMRPKEKGPPLLEAPLCNRVKSG